MLFCRPDGTSIDKDTFVSLYSDDYFLKEPGMGVVPNLSRCSHYIENEIMAIRDNGIKSQRDVARLLAWKIGKIRHRESEKSQSFMFASDWKNADLLEGVKLYGKPFAIGTIADYIFRNCQALENLAKEHPQALLNTLNEQGFERIGTVYLITLLYFLSHRWYPIYDRFAVMALKAIKGCIRPKCKEKVGIDYIPLPEKTSEQFSTVMSVCMTEYMNMLSTIFGDNYRDDRRIDQALWVYGHLFTKQ